LKTGPKIVLGILALATATLVVANMVSSLPRYNFAAATEARSFITNFGDQTIIDELGDTNGPYMLRRGVLGGIGKPFEFNLTFNGRRTNWSQPASNDTGFAVAIFENRRGNQFAIVMKKKQSADPLP
jgi:hypothetical protein